MKRFLFILLTLIVLGELRSAEPTCPEAIENYQELLVCAEQRSPEVQSAQLELQKAKLQVRAAGQWRNPDLSLEIVQDKFAESEQGETNLSLAVPVELGGKISARVAAAQSGVALAEAKVLEARAKARTQSLLKLHRLRQVIHEQEIVVEALRTFSRLVEQYSKRPNLSPEQQLSLSVFQLSKGEYELKKSEVDDEAQSLQSYFKLNLALTVSQVEKLLPAHPQVWPSVNSRPSGQLSVQQLLRKAELENAKADLLYAQSEAWPTLMVGPSYRIQNDARERTHLLGINLSLPLPLFNANGSGRAAAAAGVRAEEARRRQVDQEQDVRRERLVKSYEQSVKTLKGSLSHQEIEKRHSEADRLFVKGTVPSALVIEAHRTSLELERARHARELLALESLLEIYAIDGVLWEVSL